MMYGKFSKAPGRETKTMHLYADYVPQGSLFEFWVLFQPQKYNVW